MLWMWTGNNIYNGVFPVFFSLRKNEKFLKFSFMLVLWRWRLPFYRSLSSSMTRKLSLTILLLLLLLGRQPPRPLACLAQVTPIGRRCCPARWPTKRERGLTFPRILHTKLASVIFLLHPYFHDNSNGSLVAHWFVGWCESCTVLSLWCTLISMLIPCHRCASLFQPN
jgi:hypothetical protein